MVPFSCIGGRDRFVYHHRFAVRVPPPLGVGRNHGKTVADSGT